MMAKLLWPALKPIVTMALYAATAFAGTANAASVVSDVTVMPEPFIAGESVAVNIKTAGPFNDAVARVSVVGDGKVISDKKFSLGLIPSGPYSKTLDDAFTVKPDPQVKVVQVLVVMLEADEKYGGEPTAKRGAVKFLGECARRTKTDVQPCKYATAKSRRSTEAN
jgi:hypothetical protein